MDEAAGSPYPGIGMNTLKRILLWAALAAALAVPVRAQIAVTSPAAGRNAVKASADFADEVLRDRWDMNERTDLGWRLFNTAEQPNSFLGGITFQNGIFSAVSTSDDPNLYILDSAYALSVGNGKNGLQFPINADKYKILAIRMYTDQTIIAVPNHVAYLRWSDGTIYDPVVTTAYPFDVRNGWAVHIIRIPDLTLLMPETNPDPWAGSIGWLRLDPFYESGKTVKIDWIRLVEEDAAGLKTISWTGASGNVDIYLDNDTAAGNGHLGALARGVSGSNYSFRAGALAPGDYYAAVVPAGATSGFAYSPGYFHVNDAPILDFGKPSAEGSTDDFVTTHFSDPWDMSNAADVDHTEHLVNPRFTTVNGEDLEGTAFTGQSVFMSQAETVTPPAVGDPTVYFLNPVYRGAAVQIDASRYHRLTMKLSISGAQSVVDGSIARVIWRNRTETKENVSEDIIVRHLPNTWMMDKIVLDMATLPLEADSGGSPSRSGWQGFLDGFRIDPDEFPDGRSFLFDDVKLAADWRADTSFRIEWALSDSDGSPSVSLYYDTNATGYNGTLIATLPSQAPGAGSHVWNTSAVPEGTYWIYATANDGTNTNRAYAGGPVIIEHGAAPAIELSRHSLYMGAVASGPATSLEEILVTNSGGGTLAWTAQSNKSWLTVTPASGGDSGALRIGINNGTMAPGTYLGQVLVSDPAATNSPQAVSVQLTISSVSGDASPFGNFDTPATGSTVKGSIPVSGWALDDVEVARVEIRREPAASDPAGAIGADGLVYLGNACFIKGARSDVEGLWPTVPRSDRAGWGFMLLTYGLPNQGNGVFRIHAVAFDVTGHRVDLGVKQITSDNLHNTLPFGAIDTPAQGGTVSGTAYINFGWVLTPLPASVPTNGSTIWLWIDGVAVGHPTYNNYRADVHDAFPEYLNSDGAVGYYSINTTAYADGIHTIAWSAADSLGREGGMGSRFFWVYNGVAAAASVRASASTQARNAGLTSNGPPARTAATTRPAFANPSRAAKDLLSPVFVRTGFRDAGGHALATPDGRGTRRVAIEETDRAVIALESPEDLPMPRSAGLEKRPEAGDSRQAGRWTGYLVVGNDDRPLPAGSTLDAERGVFYWQPAPGFLGTYDFIFVDGRKGLKKAVSFSVRAKSFSIDR